MKKNPKISVCYVFIILTSFVIFSACDNNGPHQSIPSTPKETMKEAPTGDFLATAPTYEDIKPIFKNQCSRCHHRFHLSKAEVEKVVENGKLVQYVVDQKNVPPVMQPIIEGLNKEDRDKIRDYAKAFLAAKHAPKEPVETAAQESVAGSADNITAGTGKAPSTVTEKVIVLTDEQRVNTINQCTQCHGVTGMSSIPVVPHLAGLSSQYIVNQITNFQRVNKTIGVGHYDFRHDDAMSAMNEIVKNLNSAQIEALGQHFLVFTPFNGTKSEDELMKTMAKSYDYFKTQCAHCHTGQREAPGPRIQGQQANYLANQLRAFKSERRVSAIMKSFAIMIPNDEIDNLAKYISELKVE